MKAIIIANTIKEANTFLELLSQLLIDSVIKERTENRIIMKNGDLYHAMSVSDNSRNCRCDKLYINKNIDEKILKDVIYPMVRFSSLTTYERVVNWE